MRIGSFFLEFERIRHDGTAKCLGLDGEPLDQSIPSRCEKWLVFTEEDADENGRIAIILKIVQHHCGVPFEVRAAPTTTDSHFTKAAPFA